MYNNLCRTITADDLAKMAEYSEWANGPTGALGRLVEDWTDGTDWSHPTSSEFWDNQLADRLDPEYGVVEVKATRTATVTLSNRAYVEKQSAHVQHMAVYRFTDSTPKADALTPGDVVTLDLIGLYRFEEIIPCLLTSIKNPNGTFAYLNQADVPKGGKFMHATALEKFNLLTLEDN